MDSGQKPKQPEKTDELTRRRFLQTSTVALAGATLFPQETLAEPQADASLPAGVKLNWNVVNVVTVNAKRYSRCGSTSRKPGRQLSRG